MIAAGFPWIEDLMKALLAMPSAALNETQSTLRTFVALGKSRRARRGESAVNLLMGLDFGDEARAE
jgi:hypothetical protein